MELVDRLTLAVAIAAPERVGCASASAADRVDAPGVPDGRVLMNRIRAISAYRRDDRRSGIT